MFKLAFAPWWEVKELQGAQVRGQKIAVVIMQMSSQCDNLLF